VRLADAVNIDDLRRLARRRLPRAAFDFVDGGAESETGLARNRAAFDRLCLLPRYMIDVAQRTQTVELFGRTYASPFGIAPTGLANLAWPGADRTLAESAAAADIPFLLSTAATTTIEEIAAAAPRHTWFQLYFSRERRITEDLIRRAAAAGMQVLVVTADIPAPGWRERDHRNHFTVPLRPTLANVLDLMRRPAWLFATARHGPPRFVNLAPYAPPGIGAQSLVTFMSGQISSSLTWPDIDWIRGLWPGKLVIKGILSPKDAALAAALGVDGIIVSNHGGRQLDAAPAPIEMLPAIRAATGDRLVVMLDSGIRRGADIVKALALGARFVFVGRATLYGAAAGGRAGVDRALAILRQELDRALGQIGCRSLAELTPAHIWTTKVNAAEVTRLESL
jgi:isopentenyl diphosphate isomerase/L-lactate dehydrogenase-like FMN-dependent dehydrogenase